MATRKRKARVFDGDLAVGWCQYGTPDYRLTRFFVDAKYRRKGVAAIALHGALELISQVGGGVVEAYPQDAPAKKTSASFLYNCTRSLFERAGFRYDRSKGTEHCVMSKVVAAA